MNKSLRKVNVLPDGMYSLVHQFDMVHITVKNQKVKSIRPLSLLAESTAMPNIFNLGTIKLDPMPKFRVKLMSLEGMGIEEFLQEVQQINYTTWRKLPKVK